jgi:hypothetical protein
VAVKLRVLVCLPAVVGPPRSHSADSLNAGAAVIIGIVNRLFPAARRGRDAFLRDCGEENILGEELLLSWGERAS